MTYDPRCETARFVWRNIPFVFACLGLVDARRVCPNSAGPRRARVSGQSAGEFRFSRLDVGSTWLASVHPFGKPIVCAQRAVLHDAPPGQRRGRVALEATALARRRRRTRSKRTSRLDGAKCRGENKAFREGRPLDARNEMALGLAAFGWTIRNRHCERPPGFRTREGSNPGERGASAWIPERSATRLGEADLNVFSKLGNQGLEWRLEPEAFTGGEVRREDDLLDFPVGCPVDIEVARQPSA